MNRKEIQTNRMYNYFIEATAEIIEKEGVENIKVRKVAELAGYTGSTIYNYFDEFSHLIFFASMRFMEGYNEDLANYIEQAKNPLEKYLLAWECFCKHSFEKPEIFNIIFLSDLGANPNDLINRYYSIYQNELAQLPDQLKLIVLENDLFKRNKSLIYDAVKSSDLTDEKVQILLNSTILLWKGMLISIINNREDYSPQEAAAITMNYIRGMTLQFLSK